ncbi:hypothetical protein RF11_01339 [Thelohanellus kitauei]|uniref:Uncharacterized protein n=1 Tax=Thelohanellus kitauei TaxID=669202 RepID=A0A0C2MWS8_THEKT|nr:hypothetical protein RF11_01339 [Thelohanellus kitauei]
MESDNISQNCLKLIYLHYVVIDEFRFIIEKLWNPLLAFNLPQAILCFYKGCVLQCLAIDFVDVVREGLQMISNLCKNEVFLNEVLRLITASMTNNSSSFLKNIFEH